MASFGSMAPTVTALVTVNAKDFASGMAMVRKQMAVMGKEVNKVSATIKTAGGQMYKFSNAVNAVSKNSIKSLLSLQGFLMKIVHYITFSIGVQMVMGIKRGIQSAIDSFSKFERAATNAATISGYLGARFEDVRNGIMAVSKELSSKTIFSTLEVAEAFYDLASAGYDVSRVTEEDLIPILQYAAATQLDLSDATKNVMVTLKQFKLEMSDIGHVVDIFTTAITSSFMTSEKMAEAMKYAGPMAGILGISLEETVSAASLLVDRGLEASQAGQRLNMIFNKLIKPTEQAKETLEDMGISMKDLDPTTKSFADILFTLQVAGFGAAEAASMFRARTAGSAAVLVENADAVARMTTRLELAEGITNKVAEAQSETLWGALKRTANEFQRMGMTVGEDLKPTLLYLIDFFKTTLVPVLRAGRDIFIALVEAIKPYANIIKFLIPLLITYKLVMMVMNKVLKWNLIQTVRLTTQKILQAKADIFLSKATLSYGTAMAVTNKTMGITWKLSRLLTAGMYRLGAAMLAHPVAALAIGLGALVGTMVLLGQSSDSLTTKQKALRSSLSETSKWFYDTTYAAEDMSEKVTKAFDELKKGYGSGGKVDPKIKRELVEKLFTIKDEDIDVDTLTDFNITRILEKEISKGDRDIWTGKFKEPSGDIKKAIEEIIFIEEERINNNALVIASEKELIDEFNSYETALYVMTREKVKSLIASKAMEEGDKSLSLIIQELSDEFNNSVKGLDANAEGNSRLITQNEQMQIVLQELGRENAWYTDSQGNVIEMKDVWIKSTQAQKDAEKDLTKAIGSIIQQVRSLSKSMDFYIGKLEESYLAQGKAMDRTKQLNRLIVEEERATEDAAEAKLVYGINSEEAIDADARLEDAITSRIDVQDEINELNLEASSALELVNKALEEGTVELEDVERATTHLNDAERELLELSYDLIDAREALVNAKIEDAIWTAKLNTLEAIRTDATKYLEDETLKLYESQNKLFDIEYKLYKLRQDESSQLEGLFESLAEQGLLNDETIQQYREMKEAEGEVLGLNKEFTDVMGGLSEGEREDVEKFMAGEDIDISGIEGFETIMAMKRAQDEYRSSIDNLDSSMTPLIGSLIDMGIVSSDTAKQYYDLIDNSYELAAGNKKLEKSQEAISDNFMGVVDTIAQMAMAMIDGNEGSANMTDIWSDLTDALGIGSTEISELQSLLGYVTEEEKAAHDELSEFTDEELVLAAALKMTASDLGKYSAGMSGASIAGELGIITTENLEGAYKLLQSSVVGLMVDMETYATVLGTSIEKEQEAILKKGELQNAVTALGDHVGIVADDFKLGEKLIVDMDNGALGVEGILSRLEEILNNFSIDAGDAGEDAGKNWYDGIVGWVTSGLTKIKSIIGAGIDFIKGIFGGNVPLTIGGKAKGGIIGLQKGTSMTKGPQMAMIGEAGAEAVVPLEGANREYGKRILQQIIPRYFPDLKTMQYGGLSASGYGGMGSSTSQVKLVGLDKFQSGVNTFKTIPSQFLNIIKIGEESMSTSGITLSEGVLEAALLLTDGVSTSVEGFSDEMVDVSKTYGQSTVDSMNEVGERFLYYTGNIGLTLSSYTKSAGMSFKSNVIGASNEFWNMISNISFGGQQRGGIYRKATMGVFGEKGAEALIPLEGGNRKYGEELLRYILPNYYPDMARFQMGGIVGTGGSTPNTYNSESYTITGPINVTGVNNTQDFMNQLKYQSRISKKR